MIELHGERGRVEQDRGKDGVFTERGSGKRPQSVLERVFRNVSSDRLGIEGILYTVTLQKRSTSFVVWSSQNRSCAHKMLISE